MPKDSRPFITVAVDMDRNPKYAALNDAQKFLIIRAWLHCAEFLTDGFITMPVWQKMGTDRNRKAILDSGACSVVAEQNGVIVHDYLEHQQSRADAMERKEKARSAGQKGGLIKAANAKRNPNQTAAQKLATARRELKGSLSENLPDIDIEEENSTYVPSAALVSNARDASEAAHERPGKPVPVDGWRLVRDHISVDHPQATRTALAMEAATLLHAGTPTADVGAALDLWLAKPHLGPRTLPNLVSEIIRNRTRPTQPPAAITATGARPLNRADQKIQDILDRGARLISQPATTPDMIKELPA